MTEKIEVKVSHRFKASAERVYDAWLKPDKVRAWMRTALQSMGLSGDIGQIEIDPKVGGAFLFTDIRDGTETRHWGTYLELERPHKIVFTWIVDESEESDPSQVVLTIQPEGEGCIATIIHEMDAKWADYVAQTENGWSCMMEATDVLLEN
ncbi:SRPBCC domain-containing protein [Acidobacteria bacterium AH-259-A15]|nr:SRPBCC domain-containing protein [Acidobacteria bacterium AH-259-A15]